MTPRVQTSHLVLTGCALLLLGAPGCGAPSGVPSDGGDAEAAASPTGLAPGAPRLDPRANYACGAGVDAELDALAIDPRLEGARARATVRVLDDGALAPAWAQPLRVAVVRGDAEIAVLTQQADARPGAMVTAEWNGTASASPGGPAAPVAPGTYALRITLGCSPGAPPIVRELPLAVVRVGVTRMGV